MNVRYSFSTILFFFAYPLLRCKISFVALLDGGGPQS